MIFVNPHSFLDPLINTFLGTTNNLWSNPANWSSGHIPISTETAQINQDIVLDITTTVDKLKIISGKTVTSNSTGRILNVLTSCNSEGILSMSGTLKLFGLINNISNLDATKGTIYYSATAGIQTILPLTYFNLGIEGSGTKILSGHTILNQNLNFQGAGKSTSFFELGNYNLFIGGETTGGTCTLIRSGHGNTTFVGMYNGFTQSGTMNFSNSNSSDIIEFRGGFNIAYVPVNFGNSTIKFTTNNQNIRFNDEISVPNIIIQDNIIVTNISSSIISTNSIIATNSGTFNNLGILLYTNNIFPIVQGGTLNTSTTGNTIGLTYNGDLTIPLISQIAYKNLQLGGTGIKTLQEHLDIPGNFTIQGQGREVTTINLVNYNLTVAGSANYGAGTIKRLVSGNNTGAGNIIHAGLCNAFSESFNILMPGMLNTNFVEFRNGLAFAYTYDFGAGYAHFTTNNQLIVCNHKVTQFKYLIDNITLTNRADSVLHIGINGSIEGVNSNSIMNNLGIIIYDSVIMPMTTGVLTTDATTSTFTYGLNNQNIKPTAYNNLTLNGTGIKTLQGNITVVNNYIITNPASLNNNGFTVYGKNTFSATTNNLWSVASNWSLGHIPTADEPADITQDIVLDITTTVERISISTGKTLTADTNTRILTSANTVNCLGTINFTNSPSTLVLKATNNTIANLIPGNNSTIQYSGTNQNVLTLPYCHLTISAIAGIKSLTGNTTLIGNLNIIGNNSTLAANLTYFDCLNYNLTVGVNTTAYNYGIFKKSGAGTIIFGGSLVIDNRGSVDFSGNPTLEFKGGLVSNNDGTICNYGEGPMKFTTNNQYFRGRGGWPIFRNPITIENITLNNNDLGGSSVFNVQNSITGTTSTSKLLNTGRIHLGFNGPIMTTGIFDYMPTVNSEVGYIGTVPQNLHYTTYAKLQINASAVKNLIGHTSVGSLNIGFAGNLQCSTYDLTVNTAFEVGNSSYFRKSGAGHIIFKGSFTNDGNGFLDLGTGNPTIEFQNCAATLQNDNNLSNWGTGQISFTTGNSTLYTRSTTTNWNGPVVIDNVIVTNLSTGNSSIHFSHSLNGTTVNSKFINQKGIIYSSAIEPMLTGILDCSSITNTFIYSRSGDQNIKPITYWHLQATNLGTKYLQQNTTLLGNLTVQANLDCQTYDLEVYGTTTGGGQVNTKLMKTTSGILIFRGNYDCGAVPQWTGNPNVEFRGGFTYGYQNEINTGLGIMSFTTTSNQGIIRSYGNYLIIPNIFIGAGVTLTFSSNNASSISTTDSITGPGNLVIKSNATIKYRGLTSQTIGSANTGTTVYEAGHTIGFISAFDFILSTTTYDNLIVEHGTKTLSGHTIINGKLEIGGKLECGNYNLSVYGVTDGTSAGGTVQVLSKTGPGNLLFVGIFINNINTGLLSCDWTGNPSVEFRGGFRTNSDNPNTGSGPISFTTNNQDIINGYRSNWVCNNPIIVADNIAVSNYILFTINNTFNGASTTSKLVNRGTIRCMVVDPIMTTGILDLTSYPNTFDYYLNGNQNIKPTSYRTLRLTTGGVKKLLGDVSVQTLYTLIAPATLDANGFNILVKNDFTATTNQLWSNPANWSLGHIPTANEPANITSNITLDVTATVESITIASGKILTADNNSRVLTCTNNINCLGIIDFTNSNTNLVLKGEINIITSFTAGNSTITYSKLGNQNILNLTHNNLVLSGNGNKVVSGNLVVNGNLSSVSVVSPFPNFNMLTYNLSVMGTTTFTNQVNFTKSGAGNLLFVGKLNCASGTPDFSVGNPTIEFRGGFDAFHANYGSGIVSLTTNNQIIEGGGELTILGPILIKGAITVTNNRHIRIYNYINGDNVNSKLINQQLITLKTSTLPMSTGSLDITTYPLNIIAYAFDGDYILPYTAYKGLYISGTGLKKISGTTTISYNFATSWDGTGGSLDCQNYNLTILGTSNFIGGTFTKTTTGNIIFNGLVTYNSGASFNLSGAPTLEFRGGVNGFNQDLGAWNSQIIFSTNNQTLSGSNCAWSGSVSISDGITITVNSGANWKFYGSINGVTSTSKLENKGVLQIHTTGIPMITGILNCTYVGNTTSYAKTANQNIRGGIYHNLTVTGAIGNEKVVTGTLQINGNLDVNTCRLDLVTYDLIVVGASVIHSNARLSKSAGGNIIFGNSLGIGYSDFHMTGNPNIEYKGNITFNQCNFVSGNGLHTFGTKPVLAFSTGAGTPSPVFTGPILIKANTTLDNYINLTVGNSISGEDATSILRNGSTLTLQTINTPMPIGTFDYLSLASTISYHTNGDFVVPYTSYRGLTILGTGNKKLFGHTNVNGAFTANNVALNLETYNLDVIGISSLTGTISKSGAGTLTFGGQVTFSFVDIDFAAGNPNIEFKNGMYFHHTNENQLNFGNGQIKFSTNNQSLTVSGSTSPFTWTTNNPILISGPINLTAASSQLTLQINQSINGDDINSKLINNGSLIKINNPNQPMSIGLFDTVTNINTVQYNYNGNQDIKAGTYKNLTLNTNGAKKLLGNVSIQNIYLLSPPATLDSNGFVLSNP